MGLEHGPETVTISLPGAALGREGRWSCRKTIHPSPMGRADGNKSSLLINSRQTIITARGNEQEMNLKDSREHENKNTATTKSIQTLWLPGLSESFSQERTGED